jgi:hypothetical protein
MEGLTAEQTTKNIEGSKKRCSTRTQVEACAKKVSREAEIEEDFDGRRLKNRADVKV